ncbi:MAG: 6-bladed beta-propeller [Gemmatimonadota bacterium]|nr:6-bladed beta-propeller [Gemmatimonadota bacterium]MDE2986390.1 6-bladed beta-propeller [Gemmatimonadota bacterium]
MVHPAITPAAVPVPILLLLALTTAASSCDTESPAGNPARETLSNGATLVRYPDLPAIDSVGPEVTDVRIDLRFGSREGDDSNLTFGNIRGVQAASDGTIYVLDYQAAEVRVFGPDGEYLRTIARRGEGPGEIAEANGILLSGDTLLWIHDYAQNRIEGVDPAGQEIRWFTKPIFGYGYIWDGAFDRQGRYWKETEHRETDELDRGEPGPGLLSSTSRVYFKSHDLSTEHVDSVHMGETTGRAYRSAADWGTQIPFDPSDNHVVNPPGGFWSVNTGSYRLTRTDDGGDTLLVIEAALPGIPVTSDDRSAYVESRVEREPEYRRDFEAVAALMPDFKPILHGILVDDQDRLWVRRIVPPDASPFFDLFSQDGDYLGSVRLAFQPGYRYWIVHGAIYTWIADEVGVQYVVRAPLARADQHREP